MMDITTTANTTTTTTSTTSIKATVAAYVNGVHANGWRKNHRTIGTTTKNQPFQGNCIANNREENLHCTLETNNFKASLRSTDIHLNLAFDKSIGANFKLKQ